MTAEPEPERQSETLQQQKLSVDYLNIPKYLLVSASQMFRFSAVLRLYKVKVHVRLSQSDMYRLNDKKLIDYNR